MAIKKARFNVKGMHCSSCEMLIQDELEDVNGVKNVKSSFKDGVVEVEFDDSKVGEELIKTVIKNEGYGVG